jgi:uncharacterized membrane protein
LSDWFWLSHHPSAELDRCYRVGRRHVCARCLGTYPTLLVAMAVQLTERASVEWALDVPVCVALILPATLDWAFGRFFPQRGSNGWRTFTGGLLGVGLGRSVFIHVQRPMPIALLAQGGVVLVIGLFVFWVSYRQHR